MKKPLQQRRTVAVWAWVEERADWKPGYKLRECKVRGEKRMEVSLGGLPRRVLPLAFLAPRSGLGQGDKPTKSPEELAQQTHLFFLEAA